MRSSRPRRSSSWTASEVQAPDANVVSLVPSISETLMAWGIRPAAVTRFCEVPGIPTVGGTKNPDVEAIIGMGPDLVVMDAEENRVEDADTLRAAGIRVHATHVRSLPDVEPMLAGDGCGLITRATCQPRASGSAPRRRTLSLGPDLAPPLDVDRRPHLRLLPVVRGGSEERLGGLG
jgi:hypothetical protein